MSGPWWKVTVAPDRTFDFDYVEIKPYGVHCRRSTTPSREDIYPWSSVMNIVHVTDERSSFSSFQELEEAASV